MSSRFTKLAGEVIGAATLLALLAGTASATDTVRVGVNGVVSDAAFFIANREGYFKEQGIAVEFVSFDSGGKMIAPLGTGQLDAAAGAQSAGLFNAAARGIDIKIVADKGSTPPGYNYMPILVRKALVESGKVKSYKDFKGLKVAQAGEGGSPGPALQEALRRGGLAYNDVQHVYMPYPQQALALQNGAIDASLTVEPSATQAVESGAAVRFGDDGLYPNQQVAVLLYGGDFIKKRPEVAKRFMIAYIKGVRVYNDALKDGRFGGAAAERVISILTQDSRVKDPSLFKKMVPNGMNPDGRVNEASLKRDLRFYVEQKYVEKPIEVEQVVDNSFADHAVKVLGPYRPQR
jgi:NitT/TauT family transport system substrate-binding protein